MNKKPIILLSLFLIFFQPFLSASVVLANSSFSYDNNGNQLTNNQECYEYNDANQLAKIKDCNTGEVRFEYKYNASSQRAIKKEYQNGSLIKTTYTAGKHFESVKLGNGLSRNTTYYYDQNGLVASKQPDGSKQYYLQDHLSSTRVLVDQGQAAIQNSSYYPFGEVRQGATKGKYAYTGQERDLSTNLDYYNARYYDANLKHFTQPDSLLSNPYDPQQLNRYSYVRNNPINKNDPTGHNAVLFTMGGWSLLGLEMGGAIGGLYNYLSSKEIESKNFSGLLLYSAAGAQKATESKIGRLLTDATFASLLVPDRTPRTSQLKSANSETEAEGNAYSNKYVTDNPKNGWKSGDPINNGTSAGNIPSWDAVRARFWKNEALTNESIYSETNLSRMKTGLAPLEINSKGLLEPLELNHTPPQRDGGRFYFDIVTHEEHMLIDPFRY